MQELIKGSIKQVIVDGDVPISNRIHRTVKPEGNGSNSKGNREADFELDFDDELSETGEPKERERVPEPEPEPERPTIDMHELEELRAHFRREGEEQAQSIKRKAEIELARAKEDAEKIRQQAQNERMEKLRAIEADASKTLEKAKQEGYDAGYGEGLQKGTDDGYTQGLKKCKDTLLDLKSMCEGVEKEKASLMAENRRAIFDIALTVAEKITMAVFTQKDKQALEKMITEAAKEFRSAKSVRVTLSKLDLSEDVEADLKILEKCFSETANVEFEVLEEAERGTLLVETDSEILDAGVSTQLRMIEELGKGKFRDKEPDGEEAEDIGEVLKAESPKKTKKAEKPQEAKAAAEEAAVEAAEPIADLPAEAAAEPSEPAAQEAEPAAQEAAEPAAAVVPTAEEAEETAENTPEEQEATEEQ
ncbi:MAG: hypothetical protein J1F60_04170 [Oscillospiraceae bacterium]|nr:hypothetical protein [Oscillospiraceae bacterium]